MSRVHFAGADHQLPALASRGYQRVVSRGCSSTLSLHGEVECDHGYAWSCDDCPVNDAAHRLAAPSTRADNQTQTQTSATAELAHPRQQEK